MESFSRKFVNPSLNILVFFTILLNILLVYGFDGEVKIPDETLEKKHKAMVILPRDYRNNEKRYPVIFLLHGYSNNHKTWPKIVPLNKYADSLQLIFVCPDGNYDSWYLDSPVKKNSRYESFITKIVIPFVDRNYRVISGPEGRAICGSSMGGHGALTLICKNPGLFCAASSISGILDLTRFPDNWNIKNVLGNFHENKNSWSEHSFVYTLKFLTDLKKPVLIDCGLSDFALSTNRDAHNKLDSLKIDHLYLESPGNHSHAYSQKRFLEHLRFLTGYLATAY